MYNTMEALLSVTKIYNDAIRKLVIAVRTNAEYGLDTIPSSVVIDVADKLKTDIQDVIDKEMNVEFNNIFKGQ